MMKKPYLHFDFNGNMKTLSSETIHLRTSRFLWNIMINVEIRSTDFELHTTANRHSG